MKNKKSDRILIKPTHYDRSIVQGLSFLVLVSGFCIFNLVSKHLTSDEPSLEGTVDHRRLEEEGCDRTKLTQPMLIASFLGVLYMFVALAIVCDEFFVPSLEVIADRLNLSNDIAGATLMAAGGSAPELFTSLVGTFKESEVGFGTIVGSAVFNVLFVIGVCAISSKKILTLTWWPLARDCSYYALALFVLAMFMRPGSGETSKKDGTTKEGRIYAWEAFVLLCMYLGYVALMYYNQRLHRWILVSVMKKAPHEVDAIFDEEEEVAQEATLLNANGFRAGLYQFLTGQGNIMETTSTAVITQISGNVNETFKKLDTDGSGTIDITEVGNLIDQVTGKVANPNDIQIFMDELDENKDGEVSLEEFTNWYLTSQARIEKDIDEAFDRFDGNKNGYLTSDEMKSVLKELNGDKITPEEIAQATTAMMESGSDTESISLEDFKIFYVGSTLSKRRKSCMETQVEAAENGLSIVFPSGGSLLEKLSFVITFPLIFTLKYTVPDVRLLFVRGSSGGDWCYVAFFVSISWIGVYSFFMVDWATKIGATVGIPSIVMGLTFLAAGTSVPDLLSSVIVARQGHGDMAVSSSIGSNIFDVLIGLPFPWLIFNMYKGSTEQETSYVKMGSGDDMIISIFILIAMLAFVIGSIAISGWQMTKTMGYSYFVMYGLYVGQQLYRQKDWESC